MDLRSFEVSQVCYESSDPNGAGVKGERKGSRLLSAQELQQHKLQLEADRGKLWSDVDKTEFRAIVCQAINGSPMNTFVLGSRNIHCRIRGPLDVFPFSQETPGFADTRNQFVSRQFRKKKEGGPKSFLWASLLKAKGKVRDRRVFQE